MQIETSKPGMEDLVQVLQLVLTPGLDSVYIPPADLLNALHNALIQIPDCPTTPAPEPVRCASDNGCSGKPLRQNHSHSVQVCGLGKPHVVMQDWLSWTLIIVRISVTSRFVNKFQDVSATGTLTFH